MPSVKTLISQALINQVGLVSDFKYKAFDVVRLGASDFQEWELPAVQIIDLGEVSQHEARRAKKTWTLALEIIMGPLSASTPVQTDLWDLMQKTEEQIFQAPQLGLSQVIQLNLLGSSTDLHLMQPYYLGRLDLEVMYYQPLVSTC